MASPVWQSVATTTNSTAGTTCQVAKPTGVVQGDLMIAVITISGTATISAPGGWTAIRNATSTDVSHATFWKIAGASEPANYSFTWTGSVRNVGSIHRITGAHATTPVEGSAVSATGSSNTPDPPSYTPGSSQDYLFLVTFGQAAKGNTATPPTNYTERSDLSTSGAGPNSAHAASSLATRALTTGSAENPAAFVSSTNGNWVANTIAIQPPLAAGVDVELTPASLSTSAQALTPSLSGLSVPLTPVTLALSAQVLEIQDYAIFRRTPQTGAVFDPDVDTPIARTTDTTYIDQSVPNGDYDYQVFAWDGSNWSSGSSVEQVTVAGGVEVELSPASLITSAQSLTPSLTALTTALAPASLSASAQALTPVRDPAAVPLAPASLALSAQAFTPSLTALEVPLTPATLQTVSQALNLSLNPLSVELSPGLLTTQAQALPLSLVALTTELTPATLQAIAQSLTPQISGAAVSVTLVPASLLTQAQALDLSLGALTTELVPASLQTLPQAFSPSLSPLAIELTPAMLALSAQTLGLNLTALTVDLTPATLQTIAQALVPDIATLGVTVELVPASLLLAPQTLGLSLGALSVAMTPATAGVSAQALSPDLQALAVELVAASMGVSAQSLSPDLQALAVELAPALITIDGQVFTTTGLVTIELVPASVATQALITDPEILAVSIPSGSDLAAVYRRSRVRRARGWQRPPSYR